MGIGQAPVAPGPVPAGMACARCGNSATLTAASGGIRAEIRRNYRRNTFAPPDFRPETRQV
jgi:hypothetical protein